MLPPGPLPQGSPAPAAPAQSMPSSTINLFGIDEHTTYKVVVLAFMAFAVIGAINTMGIVLTVIFSVLLWARGIPFIEHIADIIRSGVPTPQSPAPAAESTSVGSQEATLGSRRGATDSLFRRLSSIVSSG